METIYTVKEVAELLKCSAPTVRKLIVGGHLKANNITPRSERGTFRVTQSQFDEYLANPYQPEPKESRPVALKQFLFMSNNELAS